MRHRSLHHILIHSKCLALLNKCLCALTVTSTLCLLCVLWILENSKKLSGDGMRHRSLHHILIHNKCLALLNKCLSALTVSSTLCSIEIRVGKTKENFFQKTHFPVYGALPHRQQKQRWWDRKQEGWGSSWNCLFRQKSWGAWNWISRWAEQAHKPA